MIFSIDQVISSEELEQIHQLLRDAEFMDGKLTAGRYAKPVKANQQLKGETPIAQAIQSIINQALQRNILFQSAVRPKTIRPFMISRYETQMEYGVHSDNALMGENPMRSDISLTLFLSDPDTYTGGELVVDTSWGEQVFKLAAGSMMVYPSTFLHSVNKVTDGVRLAGVTWVQSLIRDSHQRELLFDVDTVRRSIFETQGKTVEFDLLSKTCSNLLRMWAEV